MLAVGPLGPQYSWLFFIVFWNTELNLHIYTVKFSKFPQLFHSISFLLIMITIIHFKLNIIVKKLFPLGLQWEESAVPSITFPKRFRPILAKGVPHNCRYLSLTYITLQPCETCTPIVTNVWQCISIKINSHVQSSERLTIIYKNWQLTDSKKRNILQLAFNWLFLTCPIADFA